MKFSKSTKTVSELVARINEVAEFVGACGSHDDTGMAGFLDLRNLGEEAYKAGLGSGLKVGDLQEYSWNGEFQALTQDEVETSKSAAWVAAQILKGEHSSRAMCSQVVFAGGSDHFGGHSRKRAWLEVWSQDDVGSWRVVHFEEVDGLGYRDMVKMATNEEQVKLLLHLAENKSLREFSK